MNKTPNDSHITQHSIEPKTVLYIIYEGKKTECNYMENLRSSGLIEPSIEPLKIEKRGLDENTTDRKELVKIAFDEMMFQKHGVNSIRRFISIALSNLREDDISTMLDNLNITKSKDIKCQNMRGYPAIRKEIENEIKKQS